MKRKGILSLILASTVMSTACVGALSVNAAGTASNDKLASQYSTNKAGVGANKTITVDGDISDWDSSMIIAQGAANDDPRVYRDNSMYELPDDLYTLYGAYDDENLYLMWEMTNVQDVVAPNDDYPLSQGVLWQTQEYPIMIAVDTGDSSSVIGNNCLTSAGGSLWNLNLSFANNNVNKFILFNTKGGNGPYVYGGDSSGVNPKEIYTAATSGISVKYGLGIKSTSVIGINGAYGANNNRVLGDMCNESAAWVDFNTKGHSSSTMDFHYEVSIPYKTLGITASDVKSRGLGVMLIATMGASGMDCLPYDVAMNDNANLPDTASQENNSYEKSDADEITAAFARVAVENPDPFPTTPTTTKPAAILGDANSDGQVNIIDASTIQKYVAKMYNESQIDLEAADVDKNGSVNVKDATKIQKYVSGLESL